MHDVVLWCTTTTDTRGLVFPEGILIRGTGLLWKLVHAS